MSRSATSTAVATVSSLPRIRGTVTVAPSATPIAENRIHWCSGVSARVSASRRPRRSRLSDRLRLNGAAQESNLPSRGLHDRTGFEDRLGHRAPAAPWRASVARRA
jgi:hypothetical protein